LTILPLSCLFVTKLHDLGITEMNPQNPTPPFPVTAPH